MARFPESFIEQVGEATDMVDLVSEYVTLKKSGRNYLGLCPFHQEKTPSFSVSPGKQLYYCFGCHAGGGAFQFAMEIEGIEFPEAVELLADRAGIPLPETSGGDGIDRAQEEERRQVHRALQLTALFFNRVLTGTSLGKEALRYLTDRGYDTEVIDKFKIGFAPEGWENLIKFLKGKGFAPELLAKAGLVIKHEERGSYYDRFRGRVMFTIFDLRGRPVAMGGRALGDDQPKYLNSPETPWFNKRKILYGLNFARQAIRRTERIVVTEGYTDVITAHTHGIEEAVATLGTAFTSDHARLLLRYAPEVVFAYDADTAGADATLRGLEIISQLGGHVKVIDLPAGQDPDDFIRSEGGKAFQDLIAEALPLVEYRLKLACRTHGTGTIEGRVKVADDIVPVIAAVENPVAQAAYLRKVAATLDLDEGALRQRLAQSSATHNWKNKANKHNHSDDRNNRGERREVGDSASSVGPTAKKRRQRLPLKHEKAEKEILRALIGDAGMLAALEGRVSPKDFLVPEHRELAETIFQMAPAAGGPIDIGAISARAGNSPVPGQVAQLLMDEDMDSTTTDLAQVDRCLRVIKETRLRLELAVVRKRIRDQEAAGVEVEMDLLRRLKELQAQFGRDE